MQPNVSKSWCKYKQAYHTCANHLGGPPVSTSSCDIIVHLAGAMSGKNLTVRSHVRHQMMHLQKEEDVNYPLHNAYIEQLDSSVYKIEPYIILSYLL